MTIITVAQRKGGVGKTTLSVSIAGELFRRELDVALIDADPQRSACAWAELGQLEFPVYELSLEAETVGSWAREVRAISSAVKVIDTAPSERLLAASIALADIVVVPCTASGLDIEATDGTITIVKAVRSRRASPLGVLLVPNRIDRRTLEGRQLEAELRTFGERVSPTIGYRSAFVRAFAEGQSVAELASGQIADLEIRALCDALIEELLKGQADRSTG